MPDPAVQNYKNHSRYVVGYHGLTFFILVINLVWSLYALIRTFSPDSVVRLLLALGLLLLFFYARRFVLTVQDRVIRLEMVLRLNQLLPADLKPRVSEFTLGQLIALRFAGDEELPGLARKVLTEKLTDRNAIKRLVKNWKADFLRV